MFVRELSRAQIQKLTSGKNAELFNRLKYDVLNGEVFPAVRKNELHFYYKGGCLYKFARGSFKRDKNFGKIEIGEEGLSDYETAKRQTELRFIRRDGKITERQLLDGLNRHTFRSPCAGGAAVLDIEVDLNGTAGRGKKCDLALFNLFTGEIMFAEGKVFSDRRVNVALSFTPEVISQVNAYSAAIAEQRRNIIVQYARHAEIINGLFGTSFRPPEKLIEPVKLIVYGTPERLTANGEYTVNTINSALGEKNVLWVGPNENLSPDEIWVRLNGECGTRIL